MALHAYHDSHSVFPPATIHSPYWAWVQQDGGIYQQEIPNRLSFGHTGWTLLLPFLEQVNLYSQYDFNHPAGPSYHNKEWAPPFPPWAKFEINQPVVTTPLAVFTCPSDQSPAGILLNYVGDNNANGGGRYGPFNGAKSNYRFAIGSPGFANAPRWTFDKDTNGSLGVFGHDASVSMREVTDGLSNTVAVGEAKQSNLGMYNDGVKLAQGPYWGANSPTNSWYEVHTGPPENLDPLAWGHQAAFVECLPNGPFVSYQTFTPSTEVAHRQERTNSYHPGGAQYLMVDASVRFISERVFWPAFKYMHFIDDGTGLETQYATNGQ